MMPRRNLNLSQRVKLGFVVSVVLLSVSSLVLVFAAIKYTEDYIFERHLKVVATHHQAMANNNQVVPLPFGIDYFGSISELPIELTPFIQTQRLGVFELDHPNDLDYHYLVMNNVRQQPVIYTYNVETMELSADIERMTFQLLIVGFILLLGLCFLMFKLILQRSLSPMYQLIEQVEAHGRQPEKPLNVVYQEDGELGLLQKTINAHSQRIEAFIKREREFSAFASHELRTPVTVIKGASELLLEHGKKATHLAKPLARIVRATANMEQMIDLLLQLSREQRQPVQYRSLVEVIDELVSEFAMQAKLRGKTINLTGAITPGFKVAEIASTIIISNILRNALEHGTGPEINVGLNANTVTVSNRFEGNLEGNGESNSTEPQKVSFGLGKMIVQRICDKYQWHYQEQITNHQYVVNITFD